MKILVVGSKRHISGNQSLFDEVCYNLGSKFAKNGYILIICSNSYHTADPYIAKGFTSEKVKSMIEIFIPNIVEPSEFEKVYMNSEQENKNCRIKLNIQNSDWRLTQLQAIRYSDVVVAIGGDMKGTGATIYSAEIMEKPVILIPTFGGIASDSWHHFQSQYYSKKESEHLQTYPKNNINEWSKEFINVISGVVSRVKHSNNDVTIASIIGALCMICWLGLFFGVISLKANQLILCLMLGVASICGSMLRMILLNTGIYKSDLITTRPVISAVAGLLLGFGFILLAEGISFSLNGMALRLNTSNDLQRVGGILSSILFCCSLLIEVAWEQLNVKIKKFIDKI